MTERRLPRKPLALLLSESTLRSARIGSGLVMLAFVGLHLANLALSLISLQAAEQGRHWFLLLWRNPAGTVVLYGALLVHVVLVLRSLYLRRTLAMPWPEAVQIALGLAIPLLIAPHVFGTRVFHELTGFDDSYEFVVRAIWLISPADGLTQFAALLVIWTHGCMGLYFWLRFRPWYPRAAPLLLTAAVLVPVLALLGFADAARTVEALDRPLFPADADPALISYGVAWKDRLTNATYLATAGVLAGLFLLRMLRRRREWRDLVEIRYEGGQSVRVPKGHSVLEASRLRGIPHYSVCGGKGRCSTCRVRVLDGLGGQPEPGPVERQTLTRIAAAPDVRLACQMRPVHNLKVAPLLTADRERAIREAGVAAKPGREQEIAVLFCDIRGFTALSDRRLPFDVVFLLNRYFAVVGKAVEQAGGRLDKFIGDGAMALFGLNGSKAEACRQAITAAAAILAEVQKLSADLEGELPAPLRVVIGVHVGPAIVGLMGYGGVMNITAIGDTVNVASRLESAAKEFDAALVVSETVAELSGADLSAFDMRKIAIRGSTLPLDVGVVPHGETFAAPGVAVPA